MTKKDIFAIALVIIALILATYGSVRLANRYNQSQDGSEYPAGTSTVPALPVDSDWTWVETRLPGKVVHTPDKNKLPFVLKILPENRITIDGDCNSLFGSYYVWGPGDISIPQLASTKIYCDNSREDVFIDDITRTTAYELSSSTLKLVLEGDNQDFGNMFFTFRPRPVVPAPVKQTTPATSTKPTGVNLNGSTFRLTKFNSNPIPVTEKYLVSFEGNSLMAKFCNSASGNYTLTDGIMTANLRTTLMYCAQPAHLMAIEQSFGAILGSGAQFSLEGSTLTLRRDGAELVFTVFMD